MKKLNLRPLKTHGREDSETESQKATFFLISEGPTEESYFWGVKNNRRELRIKNNIDIEVLPKAEGQESYSHPVQLLQAALRLMGRIDENGNELPEESWKKYQKIDYKEDLDKVCIIFDRDYRDLEKKLDGIYSECRKHGIFIGISNPNFELWLLMHFPGIEKYDKEKLYKNPKNLRHQLFEDSSEKKKYLEILVGKMAGGYSKGSTLKFERYLDGIDLAVRQAHIFEEDEESLKESLGTSMGRLLIEMRKD